MGHTCSRYKVWLSLLEKKLNKGRAGAGTKWKKNAQNDKHEYTKVIILEYYLSTDFLVLILVCSVLAPALNNGDLIS